MELVAASKMKKAQATALAGKLYAQKIYTMVTTLAGSAGNVDHPLMKPAKSVTGKRLLILVSTNKGLCGGLNTNLFRFLLKELTHGVRYDVVTIGKKGATLVSIAKYSLVADFSAQTPFTHSVPAVISYAVDAFLKGEVDGVDIAYNEFLSALRQEPRVKQLLPLALPTGGAKHKGAGVMTIEPDEQTVFNALLPHYVENQLRDAILQAEASEHSARMLAMRNATDNAQSLVRELTLVYNKARQEKITYEISDIVTAQITMS